MSEKPIPPRIYPLKYQPLLLISAAFLLGIVVGNWLAVSWRCAGVFLGLLVLDLLFFVNPIHWMQKLHQRWQQFFPLSPAWLLLFFLFGILRFTLTQTPLSPHALAYYNDLGVAEITATITQPPEISEHSTRFIAQANTIHLTPDDPHAPTLTVSGKLQVSTLSTQTLHIGDTVRLYCQPETPQDFSGFQYRRYLAIRGVQTVCSFTYAEVIESNQGSPLLAGLFSLRSQAEKNLAEILPADEAALLSGIILGIESRLSPELEQSFSDTGTAHIIAISGANFTFLITALSTLLLRRLPKRWYLPILLLFVVFYTLFVGGNAAVLRAAFMVTMTQFGKLYGRKNQGVNSLVFSAAALCLVNPLLLWDLSFQLSFGATLGLVLFAEPLTEQFRKQMLKILPEKTAHQLTEYAGEYLLMSIAAQVFTMPLIAYTFKTISVSSLFANLLILPVQPLIMILGMLTVLVSFLFLPASQLLVWLTWLPLTYTIRVVEWISTWRWGTIQVTDFSPIFLIGYVVILTSLPLLTAWLPRLKTQIRHSTLLVVSAAITIILWSFALQRPAADTQIHLFDLPNSESILIQPPEGNAILLNRAESIDSLRHQLQTHLPGCTFSAFILPQNSPAALNNLNQLIIRHQPQLLFLAPENINEAYARLLPDLKTTVIEPVRSQQTLMINETATLEILSVRATGTAMQFNDHNLHVLIPGGVTLSELQQLHPEALHNISLLILNSEDLKDGQIEEEWRQIHPPLILINGAFTDCPIANCYGTADFGGLHFHSDGENYWLEADISSKE